MKQDLEIERIQLSEIELLQFNLSYIENEMSNNLYNRQNYFRYLSEYPSINKITQQIKNEKNTIRRYN